MTRHRRRYSPGAAEAAQLRQMDREHRELQSAILSRRIELHDRAERRERRRLRVWYASLVAAGIAAGVVVALQGGTP